jgi:acetoin utilization protein AcuB
MTRLAYVEQSHARSLASAECHATVFDMVVSEIMSAPPYVIEANQPAREALRQLGLAEIRHLPVLDQGKLVGMISDRDLRTVATGVLVSAEEADGLDVPVAQIMSSDVVAVHPETELSTAIDLMLENKVGALPVVGGSRLLGVMSYVDVLREVASGLD